MEYKHIEIKEANLDWIEDNDSQELPPSLICMDDVHAASNLPALVDLGPSEMQTLSGLQGDSLEECEIDTVLGILPSIDPHIPKEKDTPMIQLINNDLDLHNKKNHTTMTFPYASPTPINDYDEDSSLFTRAFP